MRGGPKTRSPPCGPCSTRSTASSGEPQAPPRLLPRLGERVQERPAVLEQVAADRTRPEDAHDERQRRSARLLLLGGGDVDLDLLPEQAAGADQADAGGGQVTA